MTKAIQEIEHTADWAIRVRGGDLRALFVNAARGMFGLMTDLDEIDSRTPSVEQQVGLEDFDTETLLVSWLNELLWLTEESDAIFVQFDIQRLTDTRLQATVWGAPTPNQWKEIKAVTFHDLKIIETDEGYQVTVVFDV